RIADTRHAGGALAANAPRTFDGFSANFSTQGGTATNCGMPNGVAAIAMNVYAVNPTNLGFIKVYPANGAEPAVSTVNYQTGIAAIATGAIVPVDGGNSNRFIAKSPAQVDFIADVVGYFRAPSGNLVLPESTSASVGNIMKLGNAFIHNFGPFNTFVVEAAGNFTMTGGDNAAFGYGALSANTSGASNTAAGVEALFNNTTGSNNTAIGDAAMLYNTTGSDNVAFGYTALYSHDHGGQNTAVGDGALFSDLSGCCNTALGGSALNQITSGNGNVAIGNIAGMNLVTGSGNIYISNTGLDGDSYTIRIGQTSPARAFIAGIRGVTTGVANAVPVYIDSNWQLGTLSSSRRVKDDIADMGEQSSLLMQLRPVTFYYKSDRDLSGRTRQYGLVAEEVEKVAPGLVAHAANGEVETVFYQFLPPMLLNEYQKQQRTIEAQAAAMAIQTMRVAELEQDRATQAAQLATLRTTAEARDQQVAELRRAVEALMARTSSEGKVAQTH
ncbi:MAG TPA: tail fiber domain-containing protein, partial [Xanthobacteraceae bacterium]|nr:tail fiber domain-containing protein [Xanthobacteraceae bacterium]